MKNIILGSVAVVVAIVGSAFAAKKATVNVTVPTPVVNVESPKVTVQAPDVNVPATVVNVPKTNLGAVSTPDFYTQANFYAGRVDSNPYATTSVTATLAARELIGKTTFLDSGFAARTLTLPATSTLNGFIPKVGDVARIIVVNQGTTTLTLAGGTGTLLYSASSTKAIPTLGVASLEFVRKANTDIAVLMTLGY